MRIRAILLLFAVLFVTTDNSAAQSCFTDYGIAAAVSENRSMNAGLSADGDPLILTIESSGGKSSLLVIDGETGETTQHFYPNRENAQGGVFTRLWASSGKYYLVLGGTFVEFDPETREWTFEEDLKENSLAMSFAEAPDGTIYVATYPRAELYRYDPEAREVEYLTRLDPSEKYPYYLAVDDTGWVYSGLGTVHSTLVAYNPETNEKRLLHESTLRAGEGSTMGAIPQVYRGVDEEVYAEAWPGGPWLQLSAGEVTRVDSAAEPTRYRSAKFTTELPSLPNGGRIRDFDMPAGAFNLVRPDGTVKQVSFDYESRGANITRLIEGPDGNLYGGTSHPMQFFRLTPDTGELHNFGGIDRVGGGNFPAYVVANEKLYGTAYLGGHLYEFDIRAEWTGAEGDDPNPRYIESYSQQIGRPRVMKRKERTLIIGGFPGYGIVGGGLAFYDLDAGESTLVPNQELVRGQSTITMRILPGGNIVAGTSIAAPGGAQPIAEEANIYMLDESSREVIFQTHPIEGATEIPAVELGPNGQVFGLTGGGRLFTFDPETRDVGQTVDLSEYGSDVGTDQSLRMTENGRLLALMTDGIVTLNPETLEIMREVRPPTEITTGTGLIGGDLYFSSGVNVWSYDLDGCGN